MEATIDKREAVGLTEKEVDAVARLLKAFSTLDEWGKELTTAYVEGMAAANTVKPPKATA